MHSAKKNNLKNISSNTPALKASKSHLILKDTLIGIEFFAKKTLIKPKIPPTMKINISVIKRLLFFVFLNK
ncbi:hypothetical protein SDC9_156024 [bioreactor metagenome]|uniref:Uncharacterized protein n=1 Tax=bioreactor metagenome TaxID=1076179 RepID=A0A645F5P6_9ZZZZ